MEIPLREGGVTLVDAEDYELVSRYPWHLSVNEDRNSGPYAKTSVRVHGRTTTVSMHKLITGFEQTDHKNGNGLDNRRENLRAATGAENAANRRPWGASVYKGVSFHRQSGKWRAVIRKGGTHYSLGLHVTQEAAARAYDEKARELFGEFAWLNFPEDSCPTLQSVPSLSTTDGMGDQVATAALRTSSAHGTMTGTQVAVSMRTRGCSTAMLAGSPEMPTALSSTRRD